jgi:hypothetical protein
MARNGTTTHPTTAAQPTNLRRRLTWGCHSPPIRLPGMRMCGEHIPRPQARRGFTGIFGESGRGSGGDPRHQGDRPRASLRGLLDKVSRGPDECRCQPLTRVRCCTLLIMMKQDGPDGTCSHFSLGNPRGKRQGDLPMLLRRLATHIAALGQETMILDVTLHEEITELGPWFSATVYYVPDGWAED